MVGCRSGSRLAWDSESWASAGSHEPLRDPLSALVIASTLGLLLFNLSIQLDGNERYGMYYLDSVFSIFAFSRLTSGWWRGTERARWITDWLRLTRKAYSSSRLCGLDAASSIA